MKNSSSNRLYRILEWIMWIMYLNILWIVGLVMGLGVLGLFPATMATVVTIREWHMKEGDLSFTKTYFLAWKNHFIKANLFGYFYLLIGYILVVDYLWLLQQNNDFVSILFVIFILLCILYIVSLIYLFPVHSHFDTGFIQTIRHAIILGFFSPITTLLIAVLLAGVGYLWLLVPGFIPVVGMSVPLYIITRLALHAFHTFKEKQDALVGNTSESLDKGEETNA